ncbi:MAG: sigma-70 family RNA polymerase sigma factor, partial [Bacilli bacterium]|nr:sigma-70 family RNA polymerase sigma factor [Bacilli bacterium]
NEILMFFRSDKKNKNNISLNDSIGYDKDGNEINLIDVIEDKSNDIADTIHMKNNIDLLKKYISLLNKREQEIIIKRYGLNNEEEYTQKEIAKKMGISRSYVSRIEKRALTKILKEFLKSKNTL